MRDAAESASAGPPPKDRATPGRMQIQRGCKSRRMQLRKAQLQKDANSGRMLMLKGACSGRTLFRKGVNPGRMLSLKIRYSSIRNSRKFRLFLISEHISRFRQPKCRIRWFRQQAYG